MWSRITELAEPAWHRRRQERGGEEGLELRARYGEALRMKALAKRRRRTKEKTRQAEDLSLPRSRRVAPLILLCVNAGLSSPVIPSPNTDE